MAGGTEMNLSEISTHDLANALANRIGVKEFVCPDSDCKYHVKIDGAAPFPIGSWNQSGPVRILVVNDQ